MGQPFEYNPSEKLFFLFKSHKFNIVVVDNRSLIFLLRGSLIFLYLDLQAEKLHTKTLPYPFTSKEAFEQSIRMPIGPEFNPATAIGALNQPEVSSLI